MKKCSTVASLRMLELMLLLKGCLKEKNSIPQGSHVAERMLYPMI
jgi:hypothetical protein